MIQERGEMLTRSYLDLCYCVHKIDVPHGFEIESHLSHECHNDRRLFLRFVSGSTYEFHSDPIDDLAYQFQHIGDIHWTTCVKSGDKSEEKKKECM
jgi:hypothetical protein